MTQKRIHQFKALWETVLVFAVFAVFGGFPIPDSNEPYYIGKAINFWNPDWLPGDVFLQSKDSHWTFYVVFGWLSFFLSPYSMAVAGRIFTWLMLAWSWRRLSFALIPHRWASIISAVALVYYVDSFNLAGEWLVGGIEGKSIAFPFVFLGIEAMIRGKWNRVWILLGIASAFHVLVGGWSVLVAMGVAVTQFLSSSAGRSLFSALTAFTSRPSKTFEAEHRVPDSQNPVRACLTGLGMPTIFLFLGGLISLFGLVPALLLDYGVPPQIVSRAHQIYVFERLYHHLDPYQLPWTYVARFVLLATVWMLICRKVNRKTGAASMPGQNRQRWRRLEWFIWGTLFLTLVGLVVSFGLRDNKPLAAEILRFYWFRLSDVAVPMGIALGALRLLVNVISVRNGVAVPRSFTVVLWFALPFGVYLFADYLLFGCLFFSWRIPAEQGIPWCIALLCCYTALKLYRCVFGEHRTLSLFYAVLYAAIILYAPFMSFKDYADSRTRFTFARTESGHPLIAYYWQDVCRWISEQTPKEAMFLVPRDAATFKWYAHRSDIGIWKDIPQDAAGIVAWQEKMHDLFFYRDQNGYLCEDRSLTILLWWKTPEEVEALRKKYAFEYVVCAKYPELPHHKHLQKIFENGMFVVFRAVPM